MYKNYLLPYKFKKIGLWMFFPFFAGCLWLLFGEGEAGLFNVKVPCLVKFFLNDASWFVMTDTDPVNEILMAGFLVSLVFIGLSREKDEDEMTMQIRMQSFVWSFWITAAVIMAAILFIYEMAFISFCFAMVYFYFILYICRFNYEMHRLRRQRS